MKISIKKYLLYSSVFAIFTEALFFRLIIDWKLLYLIIVVNYFLLIRIRKLKFNIYFVLILLGIFIHGLIANLIVGIPPNFMLSQLIGISIVGMYYYNFIPLYEKKDIIDVYLKLCLYAGIIGYLFYFFKINLNDGRLQSIFKEPAHYVVVVIPACYFYLKEKKYLPFAILFGTLILSNSSLGYIGCALMFIVPNLTSRRLLYFVALLPFIFGTFFYIYSNYSFFKMRVDDTYESLNAINTGKFKSDTNLSTYAILSNIYVAKRNIEDHPLGTGIGSHLYMHTKVYLAQTRPPEYIRTLKLEDTNATDANSMFTRMVSELGIFGLILIVVLLYFSLKVFSSNELYFAQGIVIYLFLKLFRDGHYFPPEFYFFIWLLFYSIKDKRIERV
jgi:O-Antigen ligase